VKQKAKNNQFNSK